VGGLAYGDALPEQWGSVRRPVDFYDMKGDVEALLAPRAALYRPHPHPALHPGKSARIELDGVHAGWIGELHPRWQQKYDLPAAPVLFELDYDTIGRGLPVSTGVSSSLARRVSPPRSTRVWLPGDTEEARRAPRRGRHRPV
jgi:phenylalanyl-tRNA synthetase beta chain